MKKGTKKLITGIILCFLGGFLLPVVNFAPVIYHVLTERPLAQIVIPAQVEISVQKPGRYHVWNDHHTTFNGKTYSNSAEVPGNLKIILHEKGSKDQIEFHSDRSSTSQTVNTERNSVGYFLIKNLGIYIFAIEGETAPRVFSLRKTIMTPTRMIYIFVSGVLGLCIGFAGFFIAVIGGMQLYKEKNNRHRTYNN